MREAIGGTWLTQLIIIFIFIFVAFLALSINYSKAFRVKNEIISIIEKKEGISTGTNGTIFLINNYLKNNGYTYKGKCIDGYYGVNIENNNNGTYEKSQNNKKYSYCFSKTKSTSINFKNKAYYNIKLFFKFNLPIIGDVYTFSVDGQSKDVYYPIDKNTIKTEYELKNNL